MNASGKLGRMVLITCVMAFSIALHSSPIWAAVPGGTQDPTQIPKYQLPLVIPPAMPRSSVIYSDHQPIDYYEIAMRQFRQQILPPPFNETTVWGYGSIRKSGTVAQGGSFNYPSFTIEAQVNRPVRVKWINGLVDDEGNFLPHLFAVDQTLHWANPPGPRDSMGTDPTPYTGPVPMIPHLHGGFSNQEDDGYPEAWFLPDARNIPEGFATTGTFYDRYKESSPLGKLWKPGLVVFQYPNNQRAATAWYHDHALGMTRLNVYAGPAGFFLLRGGPDDVVLRKRGNALVHAVLPGPSPKLGDNRNKRYYEIPIAIQDRSFNEDGSLFFPSDRAFFEGLDPSQLQIPFIPDMACAGPSDVSPIWNPEFFGNTMVVNGRSWPFLTVEQRRYRFRFLNGCNARTLILQMSNSMPFWQIGSEGGFLAAPLELGRLLMGPAERADVIVDFTDVPIGTRLILQNIGPDEPFGGGEPGIDFDVSDPATTGQVMAFEVVRRKNHDRSTPPKDLILPAIMPLGTPDNTRKVSLNELVSQTVPVTVQEDGSIVFDCESDTFFGPVQVRLGTVNADGSANPLRWMDDITEAPKFNDTEVWEIYNNTIDAHPIHLHLILFQVVNRQPFGGDARPPEAWERGWKDTVIAYPGEITRIEAKFSKIGRYVWHCHIIDHEDNEMMRPYEVVPR